MPFNPFQPFNKNWMPFIWLSRNRKEFVAIERAFAKAVIALNI